jgi:hypothetical protein
MRRPLKSDLGVSKTFFPRSRAVAHFTKALFSHNQQRTSKTPSWIESSPPPDVPTGGFQNLIEKKEVVL